MMNAMVPDLGVSFIGRYLNTAFLIGSGAQTTVIGNIKKHAQAMAKHGWSGVVTKTVTLSSSYYVRFYLWSIEEYRFRAMQNSGSRPIPWETHTLDSLKRDVEVLIVID